MLSIDMEGIILCLLYDKPCATASQEEFFNRSRIYLAELRRGIAVRNSQPFRHLARSSDTSFSQLMMLKSSGEGLHL